MGGGEASSPGPQYLCILRGSSLTLFNFCNRDRMVQPLPASAINKDAR